MRRLFIANLAPVKNKDGKPVDAIIRIKGEYTPQEMDPLCGTVKNITFTAENGVTEVYKTFYENDSLLLTLAPCTEQAFTGKTNDESIAAVSDIKSAVGYKRSEDNVCILDIAEYSIDGENFEPREEILRTDGKIRKIYGWPLADGMDVQPWVIEKEKITHFVTLRFELESRTELENDFGMIIRGMAYPDSGITRFENGADYADIKHYLKDLGIVYSRTLGGDNDSFALPTDWHAWMPTAHHTNPELFGYIDKFLNEPMPPYNASQTPRLVYLWGHSFEFENNKNWDLLDKICSALSNKPDVWYATNIEIYDYVSAYDSLIFSADGSRVYNPSLITVWFSADDKLYSVKSGETLIIK